MTHRRYLACTFLILWHVRVGAYRTEALMPVKTLSAPGADASGHLRAEESAVRAIPNLNIRKATKGDLNQVSTMQLDEYGEMNLLWPWNWVQELDRLQTSFWYDSANHIMIVAEVESKWTGPLKGIFGQPKVVGFVSLDWRPARVDRSTPADLPYLSDLIIDKAHRKQGVARSLMLTCESLAKQLGFPAIYLKVRRSNQAGINLYVALGYQFVEEVDNGIFVMRRTLVTESDEMAQAAA